jgi:hypothetical protein
MTIETALCLYFHRVGPDRYRHVGVPDCVPPLTRAEVLAYLREAHPEVAP